MCGIAGFVGPNKYQSEYEFRMVLETIAHRGPDGIGTTFINNKSGTAVFGHTRLSIIDLSPTGSQPMSVSREPGVPKVTITFNGEIYNYLDLRNELAACGCVFVGSSDTEVILQAYQTWGESCFARLRGMFAFALADPELDKIFLVRDHAGIKPLYFKKIAEEGFSFASEVRAFRGLPGSEKTNRIKKDSIYGFLSLGMIIGNSSYLQGIEEIDPGHFLVSDFTGKIRESKCYLADGCDITKGLDRKSSVQAIQQTLRKSIDRHLIADVPIGLFLSGGIDSTVIATIASQSHPELRTITIGFDQNNIDESEEGRLIAKHLGIRNEILTLSGKEICNDLDEVFEAMDQPTVDGFNTFFVSRAARSAGLKVALSGLGGDELFGGYASFRDVPRAIILSKYLGTLGIGKLISKMAKVIGSRALWKAGRTGNCNHSIASMYFLRRELFSPEDRINLLGPPSIEIEPISGIPKKIFESLEKEISNLDNENAISFLEQHIYMRNMLLRDSDVFSMANSLEIRVPFLDLDLIGLVNSMPGKWKRPGPRLKALLVDSVGPRFPKWILHQKKRGFAFPWNAWLRGPMKQLALERLKAGSWKNLGIRKVSVDNIWNRFENNDPTVSALQILALVVLGDQIERKTLSL
jgi:asparagine synthase (glutamine-hydrolysing)